MARIGKRAREEAREFLLCVAEVAHRTGTPTPFIDTVDLLLPSHRAYWLAGAAYEAVPYVLGAGYVAALEAAALLRDGWSPGDQVVRR